jgi:transposase
LDEVVSNQPAGPDIHVILDNFATHKTDLVKRFLQRHPNVRLHFTPTYSSWLNQVESWFSKLQRDVIDRGIFTTVADLKRKIIRYIRLYQKNSRALSVEILRCQKTHSGVVAMSRGQPTSTIYLSSPFIRPSI